MTTAAPWTGLEGSTEPWTARAEELGRALGRSDGASWLVRTPRPAHALGPAWSAGGTCRAVRCADGWLALNLPRPSDLELVPALVSGPAPDAWAAVEAWAASLTARAAAERGWLLGLACGVVGEPPVGPPVIATRLVDPGAVPARPKVLCLASLWAGPLCAHLLGTLGWDVTFISSPDRPDPTAVADPALHARLHLGHANQEVPLPQGLPELLDRADVIIEGSRPRALQQWGIDPAAIVAGGSKTWVSITGHGRAHPDRIGFGDDCALVGGLLRRGPDGEPWPVGDALADPLAGLHAAVAARAAVAAGGGVLLDVALSRAAADAAA